MKRFFLLLAFRLIAFLIFLEAVIFLEATPVYCKDAFPGNCT